MLPMAVAVAVAVLVHGGVHPVAVAHHESAHGLGYGLGRFAGLTGCGPHAAGVVLCQPPLCS